MRPSCLLRKHISHYNRWFLSLYLSTLRLFSQIWKVVVRSVAQGLLPNARIAHIKRLQRQTPSGWHGPVHGRAFIGWMSAVSPPASHWKLSQPASQSGIDWIFCFEVPTQYIRYVDGCGSEQEEGERDWSIWQTCHLYYMTITYSNFEFPAVRTKINSEVTFIALMSNQLASSIFCCLLLPTTVDGTTTCQSSVSAFHCG